MSPAPDPRYGELADAIESQLRRMGVWKADPATVERIATGGAFGGGVVEFEEWIQVVLVTRLRQVAAGEIEPPPRSQVAVYGSRAFPAMPEYDRLLDLLGELDRLAGQ